MSKPVNIISLLQAKKSLEKTDFDVFLKHYEIKIKEDEILVLESLIGIVRAYDYNGVINSLSGFYVGYKIPQIEKEFDLIRFGRESILNIEIKRESTEDAIKKQLLRNKYYLSFINRKLYAFTYVSKSQELYFLNDDEQLEKVTFECLLPQLKNQIIEFTENPDSLFNPSNYLVSPFNSTEKFLEGKYFLTKHQEEIKSEIINAAKASSRVRFISITGSAGTGKTLLAYDIAKNIIECKKKILIFHCGLLNDGHNKLIENGWDIKPIKSYKNINITDYDFVLVDEAQRIRREQFEFLIKAAENQELCYIFSHDKVQTLSDTEDGMSDEISSISSITKYKLTEKIRTNKEIAAFIKMLFHNKQPREPIKYKENIEINYFNKHEDAKEYMANLDLSKWEILRFTPSQYNDEHHEKYSQRSSKTPHSVIGQEFDGVVVTIDKFFFYNTNGDLSYKGKAYYDMPKMLLNNVTRTRNKLNIVIIQNAELLSRCIAILGGSSIEK